MRPALLCLLSACLTAAAAGCDNAESNAPPPPSSGGIPPGSIGVDGGRPTRPGDDEDAGSPEDGGGEMDSGVLPVECQNVPVVQVPAEELPAGTEASTTQPLDFRVSRLVGAWEGGCEAPVFRVAMTNGQCPHGRDHALTFRIDAESFTRDRIRLGLNTVGPDPNEIGVSIRYVRPEPLSPAGEWGTCAGASGTINLVGDPPSPTARSALQATFALDLTACGDAEPALMQVQGTFNVIVRRNLSDYCPGF